MEKKKAIGLIRSFEEIQKETSHRSGKQAGLSFIATPYYFHISDFNLGWRRFLIVSKDLKDAINEAFQKLNLPFTFRPGKAFKDLEQILKATENRLDITNFAFGWAITTYSERFWKKDRPGSAELSPGLDLTLKEALKEAKKIIKEKGF